MKLIIATFIGVVIGFFLGISFPTLSLTKVSELSSLSLFFCTYIPSRVKTLCLMLFYVQINFPSTILPSVDIAYVEDETPETSSETLLHTWSSRTPSHGANASHWKAIVSSLLIFLVVLGKILLELILMILSADLGSIESPRCRDAHSWYHCTWIRLLLTQTMGFTWGGKLTLFFPIFHLLTS